MDKIVLFDGDCGFCNRCVQFIIGRDPEGVFKFASLQGSVGQEIIKRNGLNPGLDTLVLIDNNRVFIKSNAVLQISKDLRGLWKMLQVFAFVPVVFRDAVYDFIAANRYKWFGSGQSCKLPNPNLRKRFLE